MIDHSRHLKPLARSLEALEWGLLLVFRIHHIYYLTKLDEIKQTKKRLSGCRFGARNSPSRGLTSESPQVDGLGTRLGSEQARALFARCKQNRVCAFAQTRDPGTKAGMLRWCLSKDRFVAELASIRAADVSLPVSDVFIHFFSVWRSDRGIGD